MEQRRSTAGYVITIGEALVSWHSGKQGCIALATMEAELMTVGECARELAWVKHLAEEIGTNGMSILRCDNKAAIQAHLN